MDYREKIVHGDRALPLDIVRVTRDHPRYRMNIHWHPEHEILYVQKGSIRVKLNETFYDLRTGDVLFIQGGTLHSAVPEDCDYDCVLVGLSDMITEADACMTFARQLQEEKVRVEPLLGNRDSAYALIIRKLLSLDAAESDSYPFLVKGYLFEFFGRILQEHKYDPSESGGKLFRNLSGKMKTAIAYMEKEYTADLHLKEIASEAGMSEGHFSRSFKEVTGLTPFEYLMNYRLSKAHYALTSTDMSVTEVALECGFNSVSYFIENFKKMYGITPAKFRKKRD